MTEATKQIIDAHVAVVRGMQTPSGLFMAAALPGVSTGYDKAWLRDNFYASLCFEVINDYEPVVKMWHAILDLFLKHEEKIRWAGENQPYQTYQYIHARYNPETFDEFWDEWGNKQNDAVGCILFKIGDLEARGVRIIRNSDDERVINRLVTYLASIEYWHDTDNGVWEEYEELHASSIGACVAGLREIGALSFVQPTSDLIEKGEKALRELLPRESPGKFSDLALLSLIWPYKVTTDGESQAILDTLEYHLVREKGTIRYKTDRYYNKNAVDGWSEEAEWTMGFSWLAIIYAMRGNTETAKRYLDCARTTVSEKGTIPELYYSHSNKPNENDPLAWAESLFVVAHSVIDDAN